jgi:hypothetical protein
LYANLTGHFVRADPRVEPEDDGTAASRLKVMHFAAQYNTTLQAQDMAQIPGTPPKKCAGDRRISPDRSSCASRRRR